MRAWPAVAFWILLATSLLDTFWVLMASPLTFTIPGLLGLARKEPDENGRGQAWCLGLIFVAAQAYS